MELDDIKQHWQSWANEYKKDLRATTKAGTAKQLEVNALIQAIKTISKQNTSVLEVGCGNGYNCFALTKHFPNFDVTGVDYIDEMVNNAATLNNEFATRVNFYQEDILHLYQNDKLKTDYEIVFTVRCLINLNNDELQFEGLKQLAKKVAQDGYLILIENQSSTHGNQNILRESLGLERRSPADFNHFMDETKLLNNMNTLGFELCQQQNFSSLHDILLYCLIPSTNGGVNDYDHPLVHAAADLVTNSGDKYLNAFGEFGQNKLLMFKRNG